MTVSSFQAMTTSISRARACRLGLTLLGWTMALLAGVGMVACTAADPNDVVTLEQAKEAVSQGQATLIDIREPSEHAATGVAPGAVALPMSQLGRRIAEIPTDAAKPVYLICNTQNRSSSTLKALRERPGYSHVRYVDGGMSGWVGRGWPTVKVGK